MRFSMEIIPWKSDLTLAWNFGRTNFCTEVAEMLDDWLAVFTSGTFCLFLAFFFFSYFNGDSGSFRRVSK